MNGTTIERTVIRPTPSGDPIGNIAVNTKIVFDVDLGSWLRLVSVNGVPRTGYVNARSVRFEQTAPPPPPPAPLPTKAVTNIITVFEDGSILVTPQ